MSSSFEGADVRYEAASVAPPPDQGQDKLFYRLLIGLVGIVPVLMAVGTLLGRELPTEAWNLATACIVGLVAVLRVVQFN